MANFRLLKSVKDIQDVYTFGDELGKGSFGSVHVAWRNGTYEKYAMKSIKKANIQRSPVLE